MKLETCSQANPDASACQFDALDDSHLLLLAFAGIPEIPRIRQQSNHWFEAVLVRLAWSCFPRAEVTYRNQNGYCGDHSARQNGVNKQYSAAATA